MASSVPAGNKGNVLIIGAGIMGLTSAYYLVQAGYRVTILDQGNLDDNCSYGNAGMIVPSHFIPMAAPGIVAAGLRWMLDSRSPFYVKPELNLDLAIWGMKFIGNSTRENVSRSVEDLRDYHLFSKSLYKELALQPGFDFGLEDRGILMLYKTDKVGDEERHVGDQGRKLGLDVVNLTRDQVQALEPHTELNVAGAVHYRCDGHVYPVALMQQLLAYLKAKGAEVHANTEVTDFEINGSGISKIISSKGEFDADVTVMTGGAWLPKLARKAGLSIPLMPGKGYSFMEDNQEKTIVHPSLLLEARVAVTPMNGQVRFGGTMEIASINSRINTNRLEGIVRAIPDYYSDWKPEVPSPQRTWFGFRPCSADGLPYLGFSQAIPNLLIAGGHGMMGLSLGPATGKTVAELIEGASTTLKIGLYKPERFG